VAALRRRRRDEQLSRLDEELLLRHDHEPSRDIGAAGFTDDDPPLPIGLQIVGRYRDDMGVLRLAHAFEGAAPVWKHRPAIAGMSPTGRPEGEYRSAKREGTSVSPTGRPEGEYRSAKPEGASVRKL
jgi:hypothetical protein